MRKWVLSGLGGRLGGRFGGRSRGVRTRLGMGMRTRSPSGIGMRSRSPSGIGVRTRGRGGGGHRLHRGTVWMRGSRVHGVSTRVHGHVLRHRAVRVLSGSDIL